jgi:hypothetical protein
MIITLSNAHASIAFESKPWICSRKRLSFFFQGAVSRPEEACKPAQGGQRVTQKIKHQKIQQGAFKSDTKSRLVAEGLRGSSPRFIVPCLVFLIYVSFVFEVCSGWVPVESS